jgi:type VI secretion system protein ImpJ
MKPMWTEGLFMMPQHLQLLDSYHEQLLEARLGAAVSHAWGLSELEVDAEELARGVFALRRCLAIMPDGLVVEAGTGRQPLMVPAAESMRGTVRNVEVHLAVAASGSALIAGEAGARFRHQVVTLPDAFGAAQEAEVDVISPNARLLLGHEDRQGYVTVKLADLGLNEQGGLAVSDRYIPPCLKVRASPVIMDNLNRLVAALGGKQKELVGKYGGRTASILEFGAADVATFLYMHTVNSWVPGVMHAADKGEVHPEVLYLWLCSLAGQLASFEVTSDPLALPRFNYLDLAGTLLPLFDTIFRLLGSVVSARYKPIPLEQTQPGLFVGRTSDPQLLREHVIYLIAGGDVPEDTLRDDIPRYVKVGSIDQIAKIVHSALPGVTVRMDLSPPNAVPVRAHMIYLKLDKQGRYWDSIVQSGTIAIYQPVKPERVKLELIAVEG